MSWTDERVEKLKEMWSEGKSASQIATELGGVTRNAVIGKVHRLGLSNRAQASGKPEKPEAAPEPEAPPTAPAEPAPQPEAVATPRREPAPAAAPEPQPAPNENAVDLTEVEAKALKLSLLQLTERTCKWPIGDPNDEDFHFCGLPCSPSKPYCAAHAAAAYQPMSSRRDRDRNRAAARLANNAS